MNIFKFLNINISKNISKNIYNFNNLSKRGISKSINPKAAAPQQNTPGGFRYGKDTGSDSFNRLDYYRAGEELPPAYSGTVPEEQEILGRWAIDQDYSVSKAEAAGGLFAMLAGLAGLYQVSKIWNSPERKPTVALYRGEYEPPPSDN